MYDIEDVEMALEAENKRREAQFAPAHGSAPLRWSAEKPAAAGWWWVKGGKYDAHVRRFEPVIADDFADHEIQPVDGPLSTEGWDWFAGPLPEPLEPLGAETVPND